jgi:hypothetical protein
MLIGCRVVLPWQAADPDTNVLLGAIHDRDQPSAIFDGTVDELRIWGVDRTQVCLRV